MRPKVYISGPISNYEIAERKEAFAYAEQLIRAAEAEPVNPMTNGLPDSASYEDHMRQDLKMLLECEYIFLLKGWQQSRGCKIELKIASATGIKLFHVEP